MTDAKRTALYDTHVALGAKMVDFAGYSMPVAYGSIIEEHEAVRNRVGLFDVSHMGEFLVTGAGARDFVNEIITNDLSRIEPGGVQYTVMCRDGGGVVDDLLVYVIDEERILLVVNASNIDKDLEHVMSFERPGVSVQNLSDDYALIAVQGPCSRDLLVEGPQFAGVVGQLENIEYYHGFTFSHEGSELLVTRTGYTGELGFEIFLPVKRAIEFWETFMQIGQKHKVAPVGLGARDTLRFEASFCLYGHELDEETSPLEAGLSWVVKLKKPSFRGLPALREQKANKPDRTLIGLELNGRNIARQDYEVLADGKVVGKVTSGAFSPTLQKSLCMASIARSAKVPDADYAVQIRKKTVAAKTVKLPFYKSRAK